MYTLSNKNQAAWSFLSPELEVMWHTVANIIQVILLSPHLCIHGFSLSSIHLSQSALIILTKDTNTFAYVEVKTWIKVN